MSTHSVEDIKLASNGLRGTLEASLADAITGALREDDRTLIKFHGSYQQDDRDVREERRRAKLEPAYSYMIRTRTPGGVLSPAQWLKLDDVSRRYAERGLRITTRQALQFHGVIKRELKSTLRAINDALIDTLAACGDVNRNVTVSANPLPASVHGAVQSLALAVSERLLPATRAYYELWLDEQRIGAAEPDGVYGQAYLPRKFKIGFAVPPFNDVDVYAQDLGFIAVVEADGTLAGFDVVAGGGMGATHGDPQTYPRLASALGFIQAGDVLAVAVAVVTTQRDWGNRIQRKRARLKYTLDDRGLDAFRDEVQRRSSVHFAPSRASAFEHNGDRFGWIETGGGRANLTLRIPAGRVWDREGLRYQTGLREIARRLSSVDGAHLRMTPNQNLVLAGIDGAARADIDGLVARHGLDLHTRARGTQLNALACVALPTCGLAMAEAERYLPDFVTAFENRLSRHGITDAGIHLRLSGCPNGCSRPYLAEVALVGKAPGRYNLFVGGDHRGQRLATLHRENVDEAAILEALDALLARYAAERMDRERFGDFLHRARLVRDTRVALELVA